MIWMIISGLITGSLLGFVMQRTRFCLTGGFRDMYVQKNNKMFYALLIAITIQAAGLLVLQMTGIIHLNNETFPLIGTIVGSFMFGIGIVLAGGCATGTWYRAGEGLIGSWIALFFYAFFAAMSKGGILLPAVESVNQYTVKNANMTETMHMPYWLLVLILSTVTLYVTVTTLKNRKKSSRIQLKQKYTGLRHYLFEKRYHPFTAAVAVGLIALLAWPMSASTGRDGGLGITTPSAHLVQYLLSGDSSFLDWGVFLVLGIFIGSYIAARGSKEFKWRLPDKNTIRNSAVGGSLMGFGAAMAGGCSIGNGLVATAAMSWQGWIGLVFIILGTWTMSHFVFVRPMQQAKKMKTAVQHS